MEMIKIGNLRSLVLLGMLAVMLLTAAAPATTAQAQVDQVRLKVDNRNSKQIAIQLNGPVYYYFKIDGKEKMTFAVNRGVYKYILTGCGMRATGSLDLSVNKTLVMPVCGGSASNQTRDPNRIDLGKVLKVVNVKIENLTEGNSQIVMTGPSTYVFTLKTDASKNVSVAKGDYKVKVYGCGTVFTKNFTAEKDASWKIRCP
jgi:hypothetical protein